MPFGELEQPKAWQAKIAAIDPADEGMLCMAMKKEMQSESTQGVKRKQPLNKTWRWRIQVCWPTLRRRRSPKENWMPVAI